MNKKVAQYIKSILGLNIHVLGPSGTEGAAIINFLYQHGITTITAHDFQPDLVAFRRQFKATHSTLTAKERAHQLKNIVNPDIKINLKKDYLKGILDADLVFLTQAWYIYPPNFPTIQQVLDRQIPVSSMTKLYLELANCTTIGITGSQGKSTTTTLIVDILKNAGKKVYVAGNYRDLDSQPLFKIDQFRPTDFLVMEISNRQLAIDLKISPHIAVITNIYPNHIEEHGSYANYKKAKASILKYQHTKDLAVLNYDNPVTRSLMKKVKGKLAQISQKICVKSGAYLNNGQIYLNQLPLANIDELPIIGQHNYYNILNALAAVSQLKISSKKIIRSLKKFTGIPHRLQKVATVKGVTYIDDMKSTTPTACMNAIKAFPGKTIWLIIGGWHKQVPHDQLAKLINQKVDHLITLPGTTTNETIVELKNIKSHTPVTQFEDISHAIEYIQKNAQRGDIVLMSPAGAYFQREHLKNKYSLKSLLKM